MKNITKILSLAMAGALTFAAVGCGGGNNSGGGSGSGSGLTLTVTGGREVVFEYLKAGYGDDPYIAIANGFMAKHPDVQITLLANREISSTTSSNLSSNSGVSDIYSYPYGGPLKTWIANGWVEDLTSLLEEETLDGRTMRESMTGTSAEAISVNGHTYGIPEYTNVTGFVYNVDLFNQYGWQIPNTTKELESLCQKILADTNNKVAPITWCSDADGYLYFAVENWISQYEGVANMNKFYEYGSAEIYALEDNDAGSISTAKAYALENLLKFFLPISEGGYAHNESRAIDNTSAQYAVMEGSCAMMLNGSWFENEMQSYFNGENLGMFAVPELSDNSNFVLRSGTYTTEDDKRVLTSNYGAYYFIPTQAPNKEDAKDFLLYLSSEEACALYTQYSNAIRPFVYDTGKTSELYGKVSGFGKYVIDIADRFYLYAPTSNSPLDLKGKAGLWPRGTRVESEIIAKTSEKSVQYWLNKDYAFASANWADWLKIAGQ